jgi:GntR family transcriptional regulator/MocR family aminotransferase
MQLAPDAAGLHMVGWLATGANDLEVAKAASRAGVDATPLSAYCSVAPKRGALLLGYAAFEESEIREAVRKLSGALASR